LARRPSDKFLKVYYEQWRRGLTTARLATALSVKPSYLKTHVAHLHEYCRKRLAKETREGLTTGDEARQLPLTDDWRRQLVDGLENGLTLEETAGVLGVPLPTITQLWFRKDPDLKAECDYARQRADVEVMKAVRERACGYTMEHVEETEIVGEEGTTTRTLRTRKHVAAHPSSQKLWLVNRRGWVTDNPGTSPNLDDERVEYDVRESLYQED
jgi:hypothetical protein